MYSVNLTERFCRENFPIINAVEKEESQQLQVLLHFKDRKQLY